MSTLNWGELMREAKASGGVSSYEPLPDGDYELKVLESVIKTTKNGKLMFSTKNEVQGGAHARRLVWDNLVVSNENPDAMGIFFRKMGSLGLGQAFFDQEPSEEQIASAMVGRTFRGTLGTKDYQGKKSNEIRNYMPAGLALGSPAPAVASAPAPAPAPAAAPAPAPKAAAPAAPAAPWPARAPGR